jgi:membrane protein
MVNLWTLGGLTLKELLRRTALESWRDAVFGQGGRMAFYHFLALFPLLLVFLTVSARVHLSSPVRESLRDLSSQVLPAEASRLFQHVATELKERTPSGLQLISVLAGALWAAFNGTWALIYGLNTAYEVEEHRSWWRLGITIIGLTVWMAISGSLMVLLIFFGARLQLYFHSGVIALHVFEWIVLVVLVALSLAIVYRFAPNLRDQEWRWSTPGALCALILWIGCTLIARLYFDHVSNYARSYGHLNSVIMILLWLYVTNGSILIGGEMNSVIEKAAAERNKNSGPGAQGRQDRSGS